MAKVCAFLFIQMEEDNISFEEVVDARRQTTSSAVFKSPIPGDYSDLFTELKEKCDPARFMSPYDPEKVDKANAIYSELLCANPEDNSLMKEFRRRAMEELGVKFSTERLYDKLIAACNPTRFTGTNYDKNKLTQANTVYREILENADNILSLELLENRASDLLTSYAAEVQQMPEYGSGRRKTEDEDYEPLITIMCLLLAAGVVLLIINLNKYFF